MGGIREIPTDAAANEPLDLGLGKPRLLTADELAELLRVHRSWVYAHQHELPGLVRLGRYVRFRRTAIEQFLREKFPCQ